MNKKQEFRAKVYGLTGIPYRKIPFSTVGTLRSIHNWREHEDLPLHRVISHGEIVVMTVDGKYFRLYESGIPWEIHVDFPAEVRDRFF